MGKLYHGALGRIKGSVGNTTFRRIYGVPNASATYEKVTEVANPKTANQINQRYKLPVAQKFYETFKQVLDHSRQGVQQGELTRRAFMSEVLKKSFSGTPFVPKGFQGVVGGTYPMSKGLLPTIGVNDITMKTGTTVGRAVFGFLKQSTGENETVAGFSESVIASNPGRFVEGDELTFVFLVTDDYTGTGAYPVIVSIVLDTTNREDVIPITDTFLVDGHFAAAPITRDPEAEQIVGACCIHSRKNGSSWQYSSEVFALFGEYLTEWQSAGAYSEMLTSYGSAGYNEVGSNKQLKLATNQSYNGRIQVADMLFKSNSFATPVKVLFASTSVLFVQNALTALFVDDDGICIGTDGNPLSVSVPDGEGTSSVEVTPDLIGWSGGTIEWKYEYREQIPRG